MILLGEFFHRKILQFVLKGLQGSAAVFHSVRIHRAQAYGIVFDAVALRISQRIVEIERVCPDLLLEQAAGKVFKSLVFAEKDMVFQEKGREQDQHGSEKEKIQTARYAFQKLFQEIVLSWDRGLFTVYEKNGGVCMVFAVENTEALC